MSTTLSGKFVLRLDPDLHARLRRESVSTGRSLNRVCVDRLQASTGRAGQGETGPTWVAVARRELQARFKDDLLALAIFGSVARGEQTHESDIDLLIALAPRQKLNRDLYRWWSGTLQEKLARVAPLEVTPHFAQIPNEAFHAGGLWLEVALDGVILHENQVQTLQNFLARLRLEMASGRVRRKVSHGSPYWVWTEKDDTQKDPHEE